jgi:pimeloyl-[acyl-carrier protein] methyl ester esterase
VASPLRTFLLPGLDGTGRLFRPFVERGTGALEFRVISYPPDRFLGYDALEERVRAELPADEPFALLGESFGGPLALRLAASAPPNLVGLVLSASFHRHPATRAISTLRLLSLPYFHLPLPAHGVRIVLAGPDAPDELVHEVQAAAASVKGSVMARRAKAALRVDVSGELRTCPVPVLFLGGKHDRLLRSALPIEVRALRADVEIRMLDAPHLVLQRRPEEAMPLVEDFLLRALSGRAASRKVAEAV